MIKHFKDFHFHVVSLGWLVNELGAKRAPPLFPLDDPSLVRFTNVLYHTFQWLGTHYVDVPILRQRPSGHYNTIIDFNEADIRIC